MTRSQSTRRRSPLARVLSLALPLALFAVPAAAEDAVTLPPPAKDVPLQGDGLQTAVLAGGCFWGVQVVFQHVEGVKQAVSGYAGGDVTNPTYEAVSSGTTGHAEAVQITYDPKQISYGKLLQIFFSVAHDPTQLNRQGPDVGTQYRSHIFTLDETQQEVAQAYIAQLDSAAVFDDPIVTRVDPLQAFYPAEGYHQDFATLYPNHPYIAWHDRPKVEKLKATFPELFRTEPVLVSAATN